MLSKEDSMVAESVVPREEPIIEPADKSVSRLGTIDSVNVDQSEPATVNETVEISSPIVEHTHVETDVKDRSASLLDSLHSSLAAARSSTAEQVSCNIFYIRMYKVELFTYGGSSGNLILLLHHCMTISTMKMMIGGYEYIFYVERYKTESLL